MPKIIENIRENLLAEAYRQVQEEGYSAMTIRSVAAACNVGVGTVYNYFPSKDVLVASFMLQDWQEGLAHIHAYCRENKDPEGVLRCVYTELQQFAGKYQKLFQDEKAGRSFAGAVGQRHGQLRSQIAEPLREICAASKASAEFLPEFIAEAILTWAVAGKDFSVVYQVLKEFFI